MLTTLSSRALSADGRDGEVLMIDDKFLMKEANRKKDGAPTAIKVGVKAVLNSYQKLSTTTTAATDNLRYSKLPQQPSDVNDLNEIYWGSGSSNSSSESSQFSACTPFSISSSDDHSSELQINIDSTKNCVHEGKRHRLKKRRELEQRRKHLYNYSSSSSGSECNSSSSYETIDSSSSSDFSDTD